MNAHELRAVDRERDAGLDANELRELAVAMGAVFGGAVAVVQHADGGAIADAHHDLDTQAGLLDVLVERFGLFEYSARGTPLAEFFQLARNAGVAPAVFSC